MASLLGERRTRSYASSSNATSHWVWGDEAKYRRRTDVPHTVVGYAIHHACSVFWATGYEGLMATRRPPHPVLGAGAVALVAYVVDYHCIPKRLTPGFEGHLRGRDMIATYAAFAAGLAVTSLLRTQPLGPGGLAEPCIRSDDRREKTAARPVTTASNPSFP